MVSALSAKSYEKHQKDVPVSDALARAWVLRRKIVNRVRGVPVADNLRKIWEATIADVAEKSCQGRSSHSFGLVSAVYNYNRRSAAINEFLVSIFGLVAFSFYDDKYGFEPSPPVASARLVAECVHFWLRAKFDQKKLQLSSTPTVLGVTCNLDDMRWRSKLSVKKRSHMRLTPSSALVF
eukprot:s2321_g11.t1